MTPAKVVAEIGCNHKGDFAIAIEMIETAAIFCKADFVKFQKRSNRELLTAEEYDAPHPVPENSYGQTYGQHREFLEFDADQHAALQRRCKELRIGYASSVWDVTSAKTIAELEPHHIKVPSACNLDFGLLGFLADHTGGEIHVALGMTSREEQEQIVAFFEGRGAADRVVLYACTSAYPVPFDRVCLLEVAKLRELYGERVKEIGFSGHHLGIAVDMGAVALGASWVERHFTLDRTWRGTDHAASLEADGMRRLVRDVRALARAMTSKESEILDVEVSQRKKLKRLPGVHLPR